MAAFALFSNCRPLPAIAGNIPLPIAAADILTALGPAASTTPNVTDSIARIVYEQSCIPRSVLNQFANPVSETFLPAAYVSHYRNIQGYMRQLGLYPIGASAGPSPQHGN